MTPEVKDKLEEEQIVGNNAQRAYNAYIKDFCEQKRLVLFEAFAQLPLSAEAELMETKRMLYAIDTLEMEITTQIDTGKMATIALNNNEEVKH